jgi:hypothetical protein
MCGSGNYAVSENFGVRVDVASVQCVRSLVYTEYKEVCDLHT